MQDISAIVERCRKNDKIAQAALFKALAPSLLGICRRYLSSHDEAEDAMQDAFVKIFMNLGQYRGEGNFEAWARRITVNMAISALRKKNKIHFERSMDIPEVTDSENEIMDEIESDQLLSCLNDLPLGYRTVLNLVLVEEFSHKEVAARLGISESTSRSQLARAKSALLTLVKKTRRDLTKSWTEKE